jgi:hypothetical protein
VDGLVWFTTFDERDRGLLQGDLGLSMEHNRSVNQVVGDRLLLTVIVTVATILFTWAVALPAGIYSAVRPYSWGDYTLTFLAFLSMSVPSFLFALVMIYLGKTWFGVNVAGLFSQEFALMPGWNWPKVADLLKHLWLPVVVLGAGGAAGMVRVMRANLLDELSQALCHDRAGQGAAPAEAAAQIPGAAGADPVRFRPGRPFPAAGFRRRDRRDRAEPADDRPGDARRVADRGRLSGRLHADGHESAGHGRHARQRPAPALARSAHPLHRRFAVNLRERPTARS